MAYVNFEDVNMRHNVYLDPSVRTQLVDIPPHAPEWKKSLLQRKNQSIVEEAIRKAEARKDPYAGLPEWKKGLLLKRDEARSKQKREQAEKDRIREDNMSRFNSKPIKQRDLIMSKYFGGST